jgi:hypothetical protein
MRVTLKAEIVLLIFGFFAGITEVSAQYAQFKIKDQGVYRISQETASALGYNDLSQISIYGYPGMLPQRLDSAQLRLQEIPALEYKGHLYFFLSGPNTLSYSPEGLSYSHHLYSDTLSYLLGKNSAPRRITERSADPAPANPEDLWYRFTTYKADQTNLLNSGRTWYSEAIRQGQSLNINLGQQVGSGATAILYGRLMAHSSSQSTMRVLSGNELLGEVTFDPIPNSTYGIKGREKSFVWKLHPMSPISQVRFTFQGEGPASAGYVDYFVWGVAATNSDLREGIYEAEAAQIISLLPEYKTWETSDFYNPVEINSTFGGSSRGKKWAVFSPDNTPEIRQFSTVNPTLIDLAASPELLIITSPSLLASASKLRNFKVSRGIDALVVTTDEIYESFGYGNRDLTALRNFIASVYHSKKTLKNVLILGKGTFDYKNRLGGRPNLVPIYSSSESLNPLTTFSSDDYLALIDWGQGEWEESLEGDEQLQIGIGRLPAINITEANEMVEKIIRYESEPIRTPKSTSITFLADDGDSNIHIRDAESHAEYLSAQHPDFSLNKLYLDRFEQEKSGTSHQSSTAKAALRKILDDGTLILNFIGHGNETTLTAEEIFRIEDIDDWPRQTQLALWVTATCEFGRHDSPFIRSAAEELLVAREKGAIGLLTTGRPVFSSANFLLNKAFIEEVFRRKDGQYQDLGAIFRNTKNQSMNGLLNRNFSLLGDPSLRLAAPELTVSVTEIVDATSGMAADTLKSFQEVFVKAEVVDPLTLASQPGFYGEFLIELRDKPSTVRTLGDESSPVDFQEEKVLIFRGHGSVEGGRMEARLYIPKGINPEVRSGRLRIHAWDSRPGIQAIGSRSPLLGGAKIPASDDTQGPKIELAINGMSNGNLVFNSPSLKIKGLLSDESGINVSGFLPEQDLSIQVNDLPPLILNEEFMALDNGYQNGMFEVFLAGFVDGKNTITVRAWDNLGNQSLHTQEVEIKDSHRLQILTHKVYPNPTSKASNFEFSHNRPGENLRLSLEVFSPSGQILFKENSRLLNSGQIISDLTWSFLQSQTQYPAKGTYIYKLSLLSESDFTSDSVSGKIVIQ